MRDRLRALGDRLRDHLRAVARIARWEASRTAGTVDRRTAILGAVALLLMGGVVGVAAATGGVAVDRDIYRIGVAPDHPYAAPVDASSSLDRVAVDDPRADVRVGDGYLARAESTKGQAALSALRSAVENHNDRLMANETNATAAYPVIVSLEYRTRDRIVPGGTTGGTDGSGGAGGSSGATDGDSAGGDSVGGGTDGGTEGATDGGGGPAAGGTGGSDGIGSGSLDPSADDGSLPVPGLGGSGGLFSTGQSGSPADISPPFPFASLVLAFAFLVPMNFVIQAYGSTILNERINRRGELLLVAPVTRGDIVAGKTLPYFAALVAVTASIALAVGGGVVSVAAVVPVALLFLASTFVGAMFARSFKELTFVTVTVSVFLTSYTFVPAIFTNVTPIALISPLTLVVRDLQGTGVSLGEYAFSAGPFLVGSTVLFAIGTGVYREEDMFTQRPVPLKFLDALDSRLRGTWSVAAMSALSIPFVFIAELLAIAVLFVLPVDLSIPLLLVVIAGLEELAKSLHVYAGFAKARFERTAGTALVLGGVSGLGFFVGEKFTAVVQLVGLPGLELGRAAFGSAGIGAGAGPGLALALLVAPLALHAVTASITALGATRDRTWYAATLVAAILVHAAYNLTVVSVLG